MSHVMTDTETGGTRAGCVVFSIGAVAFNYSAGSLGKEFYAVINRQSCLDAGLFEDPGTMAWWERQSPQAQTVLHEAKDSGQPLTQVLDAFSAYMRQFGPHVRIWSCGADFDLPILNHLYAVTGKQAPWKYANSRCYRTLKNLATGVEMERSGVHHNALADAKSQAMHAIQLLRVIAKAA